MRQATTTSTKGAGPHQGLQPYVGHRAGGKQVHAEQGGDHAQRQVHHHDHAEVGRIDPELHGHRQQQRGKHHDGRRGFNEHANEKQCQVDAQQEGVFVGKQVTEPFTQRRRNACTVQQKAEYPCVGDDEHDDGRGNDGAAQGARQCAKVQPAIHEHADDERVDDRHSRGFGGVNMPP